MAVLDTAILFEACRGKAEKDARVGPAHDDVKGKDPPSDTRLAANGQRPYHFMQ